MSKMVCFKESCVFSANFSRTGLMLNNRISKYIIINKTKKGMLVKTKKNHLCVIIEYSTSAMQLWPYLFVCPVPTCVFAKPWGR